MYCLTRIHDQIGTMKNSHCKNVLPTSYFQFGPPLLPLLLPITIPCPAGNGPVAPVAELGADLRGVLPITMTGLEDDLAAATAAGAVPITISVLVTDLAEGRAGSMADTWAGLTGSMAGVPSPLRPITIPLRSRGSFACWD